MFPNNENKHQDFKTNYFANKATYDIFTPVSISVELISKAIDCIKFNKAGGFDHVTIEHITYAHPSIVVILANLFNIILYTGLVPDDFAVGICHS